MLQFTRFSRISLGKWESCCCKTFDKFWKPDHHNRCQDDIHSNTRSLHPCPLVLGRFCVFYSFYLWALQFTKWINVYIVYVMIIIIVAKMTFIQIPGAFILALVSGPRQRLSSCLLSGIIREHWFSVCYYCICITFVNIL